jgi:hypothetical protein
MKKIIKIFFVVSLLIINISVSLAYDPAVSPPPTKPSVPAVTPASPVT